MNFIKNNFSSMLNNLFSSAIYNSIKEALGPSTSTVIAWYGYLSYISTLPVELWKVMALIAFGMVYLFFLKSKGKEDVLSIMMPNKSFEAQDNERLIYNNILLYYYAAQTNYLAQYRLPKPSEFNANKSLELHYNHIKEVIDSSLKVFQDTGSWLSYQDPILLEDHELSIYYNRTINFWSKSVRSTSDAFIENAKM